jgi:hypothetical protein
MPRRVLYAVAASLLVAFAAGSSFGAWWRQRQSPTPPPTAPTSESVRQLADARQQVSELTRRIEDQERQNASMREAREAPAAPEPNVPIVDLEPADAVRGDADRARSIELPSSARLVTFVANTADPLAAGSYAIDMTDPRDRTLWTISGVHPSAFNTLTLAVPRALLPPGVAHIRVYRLRDGGKEVVQDYRVRFAYR